MAAKTYVCRFCDEVVEKFDLEAMFSHVFERHPVVVAAFVTGMFEEVEADGEG